MKKLTPRVIIIAISITIITILCIIIAIVWTNHIPSSTADIKTAAARAALDVPAETEPPEDMNTDTDTDAYPALAQAPKSPANAKKEKVLNAQIQAVEAQLRFWKNEEKGKVKIGEVTQLSQLIRQNVQKLWLEKLDLQEAAKNLNIAVIQKIPKGKWQGKRTGVKKPGDVP